MLFLLKVLLPSVDLPLQIPLLPGSLSISLSVSVSLHLRVRFVASAVRPVPSTHRGFPFGFVSVRLDFETRHLAL